jgi:hypothetical protein
MSIPKRKFFYNMSVQQYRQLTGSSSFNKYGAKKTTIGDKVYDSKKEARRATVLKRWQDAGLITDLKEQIRFVLQEGYTNNKGKKIRPIEYVADFMYVQDGRQIVEDCKGMRTDVYKLKKKMFEYKYPQYDFIES